MAKSFAKLIGDFVAEVTTLYDNLSDEDCLELLRIQSGGHTDWRQVDPNAVQPSFTWDQWREKFVPPKFYPSWVLNESTCQWEAPTPRPNDNKHYEWDELAISWIEITAQPA